MSEFDHFDAEPEDSWHPDDEVPVLLENLERRMNLLDKMYTRHLRDPQERLMYLDARLDAHEKKQGREHESRRDKLRAIQLAQDLKHVRKRMDES